MNKKQAIKLIEEIRNGDGVDREEFPHHVAGELCVKYFNDSKFSLGWEYGVIHGLIMAFNLKEKDL